MAGGAIQMRQFAAVAFATVLLVVSLFGNHHSPVHGTGGIMFSGCPSVCTCVRKFARAFPRRRQSPIGLLSTFSFLIFHFSRLTRGRVIRQSRDSDVICKGRIASYACAVLKPVLFKLTRSK